MRNCSRKSDRHRDKLGGGSLRDFNSAAIVVFLGLLACYLTTYPVLKPAAFLLPSIVLSDKDCCGLEWFSDSLIPQNGEVL